MYGAVRVDDSGRNGAGRLPSAVPCGVIPVSSLAQEWFRDGYGAESVAGIVTEPDLRGSEEQIQLKDPRGEPPLGSAMPTAPMPCGWSTSRLSSPQTVRGATYEDAAWRVIADGEIACFATADESWLEHWGARARLLVQGYWRGRLVGPGQVAPDHAEMAAAASKQKAMISSGRATRRCGCGRR